MAANVGVNRVIEQMRGAVSAFSGLSVQKRQTLLAVASLSGPLLLARDALGSRSSEAGRKLTRRIAAAEGKRPATAEKNPDLPSRLYPDLGSRGCPPHRTLFEVGWVSLSLDKSP